MSHTHAHIYTYVHIDTEQSSQKKLSAEVAANPGLIAAYVIITIVGVLLLIGIIFCVVYFCCMKKKFPTFQKKESTAKVTVSHGSAPNAVTVVPGIQMKNNPKKVRTTTASYNGSAPNGTVSFEATAIAPETTVSVNLAGDS